MEKLYNNIMLSDDFTSLPSDAEKVPYLISPPSVIDVSVGRQLFVDDFLIEETDLTPKYYKAEKLSCNPVLSPEMPWEKEFSPCACPKSGGVWYDEEEKIFKMWYEAAWLRNMCYATSRDGINWDRPNLGIVEGTNIILPYEGYDENNFEFKGNINYFRPDSTAVFIDYECDKSEKYKLYLRNPGMDFPGIGAVSGDGINFKKFTFSGDVYDRTTMFYNPFRKKWVISVRDTEFDPFLRIRSYYECDKYPEEIGWKKGEAKKWMECDELDKPRKEIGFKPHLYNVDCVGYESIMLGMFQIFYGPENPDCEKTGTPKITELMPMYSRDGYHFSRPSRDSIIEASLEKGTWDRGYIQSVGGTVIINGDELWIYYIGFGGDEEYPDLPWTRNGMYRNGATGIAKLRRDGFVSMSGKGKLLTRKMVFTGKQDMYINATGSVKAEIFDENGLLFGESETFEGDSTCQKLEFSNLDISSLCGKTFRIAFHVDGDLYSFGFADEKGDFGGAHAAGIVK